MCWLHLCACFNLFANVVCDLLCDVVWPAFDACFCVFLCFNRDVFVCFVCDLFCGVVYVCLVCCLFVCVCLQLNVCFVCGVLHGAAWCVLSFRVCACGLFKRVCAFVHACMILYGLWFVWCCAHRGLLLFVCGLCVIYCARLCVCYPNVFVFCV